MASVFVTGATGYVGRVLGEALAARGHEVRGLLRPGSESKLPPGVLPVVGNALDAASFTASIPRQTTLVHLVGTPHPNPSKAAEFQRVDLASIRAAVRAAVDSGVRHFVYVSVAHPAPVMRAYIAVRTEGERLLGESGLAVTVLRPWYVLGPGHYWPYLLTPAYALLRWWPSTRETALRLGLVTRPQMVRALVRAVENAPASGVRVVGVPEIRLA